MELVGTVLALPPFGVGFFSIPERAWSWLERCSQLEVGAASIFQSLRGLGVGWNAILGSPIYRHGVFQSLRGLGVGWNARGQFYPVIRDFFSIPERAWSWLERGGGRFDYHNFHFQSLRGLGVGWNPQHGPGVNWLNLFNP